MTIIKFHLNFVKQKLNALAVNCVHKLPAVQLTNAKRIGPTNELRP